MQILCTCPKCFRVNVPLPKPTGATSWEYTFLCVGCKRVYSLSANVLQESEAEQVNPYFETYDEKGDRKLWKPKKS
jgi:hypothetical protein